jgi:beta-glucanase (GH16 family)/uncharacterized protein YcfL
MKKKCLLLLSLFLLSSCSLFEESTSSNKTSSNNSSLETSTSSNNTLDYTSSSSKDESTSEEVKNEEKINLLKNSDFASLDAWTLYANTDEGGSLNVLANGDSSLKVEINNQNISSYWGIQILQNNLNLNQGSYYVEFDICSSNDRDVQFIVQKSDYNAMPLTDVISLKANVPYHYASEVIIASSASYLYGFMLGNINGTLSSNHQIEISSCFLGENNEDTSSNNIKNHFGKSLIFNDEFNDIDTSIWNYDIGTGSWGWGNYEQQYYTANEANINCKDGILNITALKQSYNNSSYTSAKITTKGKFSFKYGVVESRIKLPSMNGIWPAFWMLGSNIDTNVWPYCGEIDIVEAINSESLFYSTLHWNDSLVTLNATSQGSGGVSLTTREEYHIYSMNWEEDKITFYLDYVPYYSISISKDTQECFAKEFYLIYNVAVGGTWPGYNIGNDFPCTMSVDYLRVYQ